MAAPLRVLLTFSVRSCALNIIKNKNFSPVITYSRRFLLSEAYTCQKVWEKQLEDPAIQQANEVGLSDFAIQVHNELEETGSASAVDINVLSHLLGDMEEEEVDYVEDIMERFNYCFNSLPRNDSTYHAIVRGYIESGESARLPDLLSNRLRFGIFPNHFTLNLAINHFLLDGRLAEAARVVYCSTMQEDFSDPVNVWLSLHVCVQRLLAEGHDGLAPPPTEPSDGEEDWIRVRFLPFPYYDDHFDITDERFLMGKTMVMLSETGSVEIPADLRTSLKVIGCGLFRKFPPGLSALKEVCEGRAGGKVSEKAMESFAESLEKMDVRDADEPQVEMALRRQAHEARKLLPTKEEMEVYKSEFAELRERLYAGGHVLGGQDLGQYVLDLASAGVKDHEAADISKQQKLFDCWSRERSGELERQVQGARRAERIEEMKELVVELQEQEEMLTYFDQEENIRLSFLDCDRQTDPNLTISK